MTRYVKMNRRGYEVIVPAGLFAFTEKHDLNIKVIKASGKKPSTLQLSKGSKYVSTVKEALGIKSFKNGNPLDFRFSNVVLKKEAKETK